MLVAHDDDLEEQVGLLAGEKQVGSPSYIGDCATRQASAILGRAGLLRDRSWAGIPKDEQALARFRIAAG